MKMRDVIRIATLGALWGAVEVTLGGALHAAGVPFNGTLLTAIGLGIALVGASVTKTPGTILGIAIVAALLKPLSIGGGNPISPMIAIVIEGAIAEGVFRAFRYQAQAGSFIAAMTAGLLWDVLHPLLVGSLVAGREIAQSYARVTAQGGKLLGLGPSAPLVILGVLILLRLVIGIGAGMLAWSVARAVGRRRG